MTKNVDLTFIGVTKSFGRRNKHQAVAPLDLTVTSGETLGIVGESGSGKSTLARMMVGLESPSTGDIYFNGANLKRLMSSTPDMRSFRRDVQFIGQDTTASFDPRHTLRWSLCDPLKCLHGLSTKEANEKVDETVSSLGLDPGMADRWPSEVSGGQRQRFAIARALVVDPALLVCDEVVSALDVSVQGAILNLIKAYCKRTNAGLIFVSHGLPATAFVTEEIAVMHMGKVVERGNSLSVLRDPKAAYTRRLVDAYTASSTRVVPRISVAG